MGIEDAVVLDADRENSSIRLLYDDGPDLWVPASWVVQPVPAFRPEDSDVHPQLFARTATAATFGADSLGAEWP